MLAGRVLGFKIENLTNETLIIRGTGVPNGFQELTGPRGHSSQWYTSPGTYQVGTKGTGKQAPERVLSILWSSDGKFKTTGDRNHEYVLVIKKVTYKDAEVEVKEDLVSD